MPVLENMHQNKGLTALKITSNKILLARAHQKSSMIHRWSQKTHGLKAVLCKVTWNYTKFIYWTWFSAAEPSVLFATPMEPPEGCRLPARLSSASSDLAAACRIPSPIMSWLSSNLINCSHASLSFYQLRRIASVKRSPYCAPCRRAWRSSDS